MIPAAFYSQGFFNFNDRDDISCWDTSSVQNMTLKETDNEGVVEIRGLFQEARIFNQSIGCWGVSSVTDMDQTFEYATEFNQDLSNWDVGSVKSMHSMFLEAWGFNQDLSKWDVSKVICQIAVSSPKIATVPSPIKRAEPTSPAHPPPSSEVVRLLHSPAQDPHP